MAKPSDLRLRHISFALGMMLPLSVGCAFPNGSMSGDPMLGSFNRPIVRTPPPERGGISIDSPAYDSGSRIGVGYPEVPTAVENSNGFMSLPNLTVPNLFSRGIGPSSDDVITRRNPTGASLMSPSDPVVRGVPALPKMPTQGGDSVMARAQTNLGSITSGASIEPAAPVADVKMVRHETPISAEPVKIYSAEEGQNALTALGARSQRMEQSEGGEWVFSCVYGSKLFEGRSKDRMDAVRIVLEHVRKDH